MKQNYLLSMVLLLGLGGCASQRSRVPQPDTASTSKPTTKAAYLSATDVKRVRNPEFVKSYYVGRRPTKDGRRMHEAHRVYQLEKSNRWNLLRNNPALRSSGPVRMIADSAFRPLPKEKQLKAERNKQESLTNELQSARDAVVEQLDQLRSKAAQQSDHAALIKNLQRELLKERQARLAWEQQLKSTENSSNEQPTNSNRAEALRQWGAEQGR